MTKENYKCFLIRRGSNRPHHNFFSQKLVLSELQASDLLRFDLCVRKAFDFVLRSYHFFRRSMGTENH
jgi:hypothetical protein